MGNIIKYTATLGFIGYLPHAPGTFGTAAAFLVFILIHPSTLLHLIILLVIIPVGTVVADRAEVLLNDKDSGHIVIDEFCGYFLSVFLIPFSIIAALAAFFLFRLFDILKPFPIRTMESSLNGGIGIMADDLMAGMYTNIVLHLLMLAIPGVVELPS